VISLHRAALPAALAALGLGAAAAARALRRVEVNGDSMAPALLPGDRLLLLRVGLGRLRRGDVVAVRDPRDPDGRVLVKRVAAMSGGGLVVLGDNLAASTDSRSFGAVPRSLLLGRCVWRYAPEERRGRVQDAPPLPVFPSDRGGG
jgi:nickel-type superoxide dismutase maturation protease